MNSRLGRATVGAALCLGVLTPLGASAASATPGAPVEETTTVIVTMRQQATLDGTSATGRKTRLKAVLNNLQATADQAQVGIRRSLDTWVAEGAVTSYAPLWVLDAVSVTATPEVIRELAARPDVSSVTSDAVDLVPAAATQNLVDIGAPAVWELGDTGSGVVVATLDSGADVSHPDLEPNWRGGTNSWFDPYGQHTAGPVDLSGHGTATLGAMVGGSTSGTAIGAAPGASWIAARVFNDSGAATTTAVHQAFQWILDPDGDPATADAPRVVNGSWSIGSGPGCDLAFQPDVQALSAAGILPVFAAGNFGAGPSSGVSPANYPESLAVGALTTTGGVLGSSGRGPSTCGGRTGQFPDLVAPGQDILTADRYGLYQVASGTSMAAPHAAGALALLLSAHPGLSAEQQRQYLVSTATDLGPAGQDPDFGAGRVDAFAAYQAALAPAPDFTVAAAPLARSVVAGAVADFDVTVAPQNGFSADVTLTAAPPPGFAGTFLPVAITGGSGTSTLTVTTPAGGVPGDYQLTVTATGGGLAHDVPVTVSLASPPPPPPPPARLELSTRGDLAPPGLGGAGDAADVISWDGVASFARVVDASSTSYGLPPGANLDGFSRSGPTSFYASFAGAVRVPGIGMVQDEDVVRFNGSRWRTWFDGSSHGLTEPGLDLDAIAVSGKNLYFSTTGDLRPPRVSGKADDADIYRWNGHRFTRFWNASAKGLAAAADVDGLDVRDAGRLYLSFEQTTTPVPGLGAVQDEDVVRVDNGSWSVYFDGTSHGLTSAALDVDAFDVP
jgi:subtilisin family serine protease